MPTLGDIRTRARHHLGEPIAGVWADPVLDYFVWEACNEHAQRAYSNKVIRYASSMKYVQDYLFPPYFGELCSIRYFDEDGGDRELDYTTKRILRDLGYRGTEIGRASCFYREQDSFGLFPIPEKPLVLDCSPEGFCETFTPIIVNRDKTPVESFKNFFSVQITEDMSQELVENDGLDPECVYVSQIGVFLRRKGTYYPGNLFMSLQEHPEDENFLHKSGPVPAETINPRAEWIVFDFTENPIEIRTQETRYVMRVFGDEKYQDANPENFGGVGVEIGITPDAEGGLDSNVAYIQMHRLRNDIEIEHYSNVCAPLEHDDQYLEIPERYHHTIVAMVVSKAFGRNNYNLVASREWSDKANKDIKLARAQAIIPTLGLRNEVRTTGSLVTDMQYQGDGKFRLRFGNLLGG